MRLGGWKRLFILVATLYLVAVVTFTAFNYPTVETTHHLTEFYERMNKESVAILTAALDSREIIRVEMPNGHVIPFAANTPKEQMEFVGRHYYEIVTEQAVRERWSFFGKAFLAWFLPVLSLYAICAAVGWVYRGFKAS